MKTHSKIITTAALLGIIALSGCSSEATSDQPVPTTEAPTTGALPKPFIYDETKILAAIYDVDADEYSEFPDGSRCEYAVLLTDAGGVSLYAEGGSTVATNPTRDVGVKVIGNGSGAQKSACFDLFTDALAPVAQTAEWGVADEPDDVPSDPTIFD